MELGRDLGMGNVWGPTQVLINQEGPCMSNDRTERSPEVSALDSQPGSEHSSNMLFFMRYNQGSYPTGSRAAQNRVVIRVRRLQSLSRRNHGLARILPHHRLQ